MGLFDKKSNEEKEFDKIIRYYIGGAASSDFFKQKAAQHNKNVFRDKTINPLCIKNIMKKEFKNGKLSVEDIEIRLDELLEIDNDALDKKMSRKGFDTSVIKTPNDLYNFLEKEYGPATAEKSKKNDREYRKDVLFKKYGINAEEAYCFECTIEERRSSTFTNTNRRNVDNAYAALFDDHIAIIKESVFLKSDMGMRKVYFKNVTSIDYDTSGALGLSSSLFLNMHSGEYVQLKNIAKKHVDEVQRRYEIFINNKNVPNTVHVNQNSSDADELLKYAELYEKGLLTKEEFDMKKAEILGTPIVNENETEMLDEDYSLKQESTIQDDIISENKPKFCSNCGTPIDSGSNFCTNCGNKL